MRSSFLAAIVVSAALASAAQRPIALAVMPFAVQGSDSASGGVYAEVLADELLKSGMVRVLERSQMDRILKEQGFQQSGACDASDCAVEVGRLLGIERMVVGSVGRVGQSGVFTLRAVEVRTGEVVASQRRLHQGTPEQVVTDLLPALAHDLLLGMGMNDTVAVTAPLQSMPAEPPTGRAQKNQVRSKTGWSLGADVQFQPKGVGIEESTRGGSLGATRHLSSLPWLEMGAGADLSLRHRRNYAQLNGSYWLAPSTSAFGIDGRLECVLKPGLGVRAGGQVGYFVPWYEKRYECEGSQRGFLARAFLGWEKGAVAIDGGIETDWSGARDLTGKAFSSEAFVLSVRWRLL